MLNPSSKTVFPRAIVLVNGQQVPGWAHIDVSDNAFYEANTYHIEWPLSALQSPFTWADWAQLKKALIEVYIGHVIDPNLYDARELHRVMIGYADEFDADPVADELTVRGRDFTALLIDAKTTKTWVNYTASQVATELAKKYGLTPKVTPTHKKIGTTYWNYGRQQTQHTEWNILTYLAQQTTDSQGRQFAAYVRGKELYFGPKPDLSGEPYVLQWGGAHNETQIRFSHNMTLARDISVKVITYSMQSNKVVTKTVHGKNGSGLHQDYVFVMPGLTPEQALRHATAKLHELTAHEMRVQATLPADESLHIDSPIEVSGTNTAFDQRYYPARIRRTFNESGYLMHVEAKNHSTNTVLTP